MQNLLQDLRYGLRMLFKQPGFTAVAVLALALGIGANTVIFSYLNAVMFRILRFPEPERLAFVWSSSRATAGSQNPVSAPDFADWREQARSFEGMSAMAPTTRTLSETGGPEFVMSTRVTTNFFEVIGTQPAVGRTFLAEESRPGSNRVVVMSHRFWQRRFGGDPEILSQPIVLDGERYEVVGITSRNFNFVFGSDLWEPLALDELDDDRNRRFLTVFGRLKPGVTFMQAAAEMESITGRIERHYPATNRGWGAMVMTAAHALLSEQARQAMVMMTVVVLAVLLIACANIANLQFARAAARYREIAIRLALGASRFRLVRQLLTENLLLALLGGTCGLLLARWGMSLILARYVRVMPFLEEAAIDGRVLGYTMVLAIFSALLFGLVPALQASRTDLQEGLKEGGRSGAVGRRTSRARTMLVVAEVSLAIMLLVTAGLLVRTMINFQFIEPGFDTRNLLTMRISLPQRNYATDQLSRDFFERAVSQIAALPGVRSAGAVSRLPLAGGRRNPRRSIRMDGRPETDGETMPWALDLTASPGYFGAMGIPLLEGRLLSENDAADAPRVTVISETMARKYWPNESPLGRKIRLEATDAGDPWIEIVGVVGDVRNDEADEPPLPQLYLPHAQNPGREMSLILRADSNPYGQVVAVRHTLRTLDPDITVYHAITMEQLLYDDLSGVRIVVEMLNAFAALALILAAVGIYGVMSYSVAQRRNEVGVRMALGATRRDVLRLVISQGMKMVALGVVIGLAGTFAVTRMIRNLLFGVSATDPLTLAAIALLLTGVALLACCIPARRAAKLDAWAALRYE